MMLMMMTTMTSRGMVGFVRGAGWQSFVLHPKAQHSQTPHRALLSTYQSSDNCTLAFSHRSVRASEGENVY
uniref:Putative secreted protein n=1 Tax=Anopheles triannulatus TaxID=58253 RepID=A0A2M4B1Q0_9DIPT